MDFDRSYPADDSGVFWAWCILDRVFINNVARPFSTTAGIALKG